MKTEYQPRGAVAGPVWSEDVQFLRENCRQSGVTLWRRETETPEEAAVRRWNWIESREKETRALPNGTKVLNSLPDWSFAQSIDKFCPPPPTTEVQVDWDSLEPVKEVPVWFSDLKKVWAAGIEKDRWICLPFSEMAHLITSGKVAIGSTRENALRNLAELQSIKR